MQRRGKLLFLLFQALTQARLFLVRICDRIWEAHSVTLLFLILIPANKSAVDLNISELKVLRLLDFFADLLAELESLIRCLHVLYLIIALLARHTSP